MQKEKIEQSEVQSRRDCHLTPKHVSSDIGVDPQNIPAQIAASIKNFYQTPLSDIERHRSGKSKMLARSHKRRRLNAELSDDDSASGTSQPDAIVKANSDGFHESDTPSTQEGEPEEPYTESQRFDGSEGSNDATNFDQASNRDRQGPRLDFSKSQGAGQHRKSSVQNGDFTTYTSELYKSNTFKLNLDYLLSQAVLRPGKTVSSIEAVLRDLKRVIEQIPSRGPLPIMEAEANLIKNHGVAVPFPNPRPSKDAQYKLQYQRPAHINAVGSFPLKLLSKAKTGMTIDLVVTMPSTLFQEKDYLDFRYFYRRAYYIACIAAGIKDSDETFALSFDTLNGNALLPILAVSLPNEDSTHKHSKFRIQIIPATPDGIFSVDRTLPSRSNVRRNTADVEAKSGDPSPTPFYNASLRSDGLVTSYLKLLHDAATACNGFRDACILGRVWLRRRGLAATVQQGGFGNFEWACLMALLLQNSRAGASYLSYGFSSYQLFKGTLQFLASKDLLATPFVSGQTQADIPKETGIPYFFDAARGLNILYKMTTWSYKLLRFEALNSVSMLGDRLFDPFDATFSQETFQLARRYDAVVKVPVSSLTTAPNRQTDVQVLESCQELYDIFSTALTDRVRVISLERPHVPRWALNALQSRTEPSAHVVVGLIVDPTQVGRSMEYGPPKDDKREAKKFRQFWGEKAELRQFNDLRVLESVKWDDKVSGPSVLEQIISHVLQKHIGDSVAQAASVRIDFLSSKSRGRVKALPNATKDYQPILNAFTTLEKNIRALEGLPLQIRRVVASDPLLRYCSIKVPSSTSEKPFLRPADVIVQFEGSARWPDDLRAIQRTKLALLIKLEESLSDTYPNITARVGVENLSNPMLNQVFLDTFYLSLGFTFRLRIYHDREMTLLERLLRQPGRRSIEKEHQAHALATCKRDFLRRPAHTQALQTLCTRFLALAPAIRLMKAWFASHLLLGEHHIPHEIVELLVARTFTNPWPWAVPGSASTAFARTLEWISKWDWKEEPLIVDFSADTGSFRDSIGDELKVGFTAADVQSIKTRFEAWRRLDPAMNRVVIFAASSVDDDGTTYTDHAKPARVVASRMTALAHAASSLLSVQGFNTNPDELFVTAMSDFDFILRLDPKTVGKAVGRDKENGATAGYKNLEVQRFGERELEWIGFTPVESLLDQIRAIYRDVAVFFYDEAKADVICGLWNPAMRKMKWRGKVAASSTPVGSDTSRSVSGKGSGSAGRVENDALQEVNINKRAILSDIARLGGDAISKVEIIKAVD